MNWWPSSPVIATFTCQLRIWRGFSARVIHFSSTRRLPASPATSPSSLALHQLISASLGFLTRSRIVHVSRYPNAAILPSVTSCSCAGCTSRIHTPESGLKTSVFLAHAEHSHKLNWHSLIVAILVHLARQQSTAAIVTLPHVFAFGLVGIDAPTRISGDTEFSGRCRLINPKRGTFIDVNAAIRAWRHVHMTPAQATMLKVADRDLMALKVKHSPRAPRCSASAFSPSPSPFPLSRSIFRACPISIQILGPKPKQIC